MATYFLTIWVGLDGLAQLWRSAPRERVLGTLGEFRHLTEAVGDRYGSYRSEATDDGYRLLFQEADTGVRFGLALLSAWARERSRLTRQANPVALRLGCHFGDCLLVDGGGWLGRSASFARAVMGVAPPDRLLATQTVIDLLDAPLYQFKVATEIEFEGDHLGRRSLYEVTTVDRSQMAARPPEDLGATEWFLRGIGKVGTDEENTDVEAAAYRRALRLRPDYPEAHNNLAVVLRAMGDSAGAAHHYLEALRLRPDYPDAHYNYAILLASTGRLAGASDHLREALRLRPDYPDAHHAYANLLRECGDLRTAESHYREALRLRPDNAEIHNNLALLLEDAGVREAAVDHLQQALRLRPDYAEAHYNLALLFEAEADHVAAERAYKRALEVRPSYAEAHNNLAVLLQAGGRLGEAETHYRSALRLRPADPEVHHNLGLLLRREGRTAQAADHLRIAQELAPTSPMFRSEMNAPAAGGETIVSPPGGIVGASRTGLTGREMEVAALVAEGLTNRRIAARLGISERTVEKHVENVMNKLGFVTRAQIAVWAARQT